MKTKTLFMETTNIEASQTVGEIQRLLGSHGASAVLTEYDRGDVIAVSFRVRFNAQDIPFRLPCRWESILKILQARRKRRPYKRSIEAQARRVAWRQILRWIISQLALVQTQMASMTEVFLPYLQIKHGETFRKLCECGCGQGLKGSLYKGRARRFIRGHNQHGDRHHNWNDGRTVDNHGYLYVLAPDHPRANSKGYVKEHLIIAEKALGKSLPVGSEVHHFPHRTDFSHLVICEDHAYHALLEVRTRAYLSSGNSHHRKCYYCKTWDDPKNLFVKGNFSYHRTCKNKLTQEMREKYGR